MVAADTVGSAACADLLSHRKVELTGVAEQQNTTFPISEVAFSPVGRTRTVKTYPSSREAVSNVVTTIADHNRKSMQLPGASALRSFGYLARLRAKKQPRPI